MKRLSLITAFIVALASQGLAEFHYAIGTVAIQSLLNNNHTTALAANYVAFRFRAGSSRTINKVRILANVVGGLSAGEANCDIFADSGGQPTGTALQTSSTVTSIPTAGTTGWMEFTGYTQAVTQNTNYWFVFRNTNATPTTNYFAPKYWSQWDTTGSMGPTFPVKFSTNSGGAWSESTGLNPIPVLRVDFSSGNSEITTTFENTLTPSAANVPTNFRVRSTIQSGITFTTPANGSMVLKSCGFMMARVGFPTGTLSCRIMSDDGSTVSTVADSTISYVVGETITSTRWTRFGFNTPVTLAPSTKYRMLLIESTQSDATTAYYATDGFLQANDAASLTAMPMGGSWSGTYCPSACTTRSSWVDDVTFIPRAALLLDPAGEFAATSGGAGGQQVYVGPGR